MSEKSHSVSQVAAAAGITVRTLHHYDAIGLLVPSGRSASGYRQYQPADLRRLHQILLLRQLEFGLEEIRSMIDDPEVDRCTLLLRQRQRIQQRQRQLEKLLDSVERALRAEQGGAAMNEEEMLSSLEDFDNGDYSVEVERRWGDTDAYRESRRRTKRYDAAAWKRIRDRERRIAQHFAQVAEASHSPTSDEAADVAECHRLHIDEFYYPCSHAQHVALGDLYTQDPRFRQYWEEHGAKLAAFVQEAIATNALRSGAPD